MPFVFEQTSIPAVVVVSPRVFDDERGSFAETYKASDFAAHGIDLELLQVNESRSTRGVVRGLHYQVPPRAIGKLVRVLRGSVLDVAVDIRRGSPWFGHHVAVTLRAGSGSMLWVPPGFAHGFCALDDDTHFLYLQSGEYAPEAERGLDPFDPGLGIDWMLPQGDLIVSTRDLEFPRLAHTDPEFRYEPA